MILCTCTSDRFVELLIVYILAFYHIDVSVIPISVLLHNLVQLNSIWNYNLWILFHIYQNKYVKLKAGQVVHVQVPKIIYIHVYIYKVTFLYKSTADNEHSARAYIFH